jgi:hypothetical protein
MQLDGSATDDHVVPLRPAILPQSSLPERVV